MFKGLLKLLKSNADYYIIKYMEKNKLKNEDMGINENEEDDDDEEDIYKVLPNDDNVDYEDEEDMWD